MFHFIGFLHIENIETSTKCLWKSEAMYIFWVKEVFCTFSMFYIMVIWITMLPCSHQFFVFQFMHSTCSEIWGLSTPNTIDQWDTTGLYSFSEQTRWIFCPLSNPRDLVGGRVFWKTYSGLLSIILPWMFP